MQRMAMIIGVKPEMIDTYRQLHATVWPEILDLVSRCNIRNYTIFLKEPENLLFGYWEYYGADIDADMAKMAASEKNQEWWAFCIPCQQPMETRKPGEWWAMMEPVFHHD